MSAEVLARCDERGRKSARDFIFGTCAKDVEADTPLASKQPCKALIEHGPRLFEEIGAQDPAIGVVVA